jgi:hypothetical protein
LVFYTVDRQSGFPWRQPVNEHRPNGNGAFDVKDVNILKGIGKWIDKNRESIYQTHASPLPLQSWGVTTMKKNLVYLHVFNWPADGKLNGWRYKK